MRRRTEGQALLMVTIALAVMCGMLGLAIDFGWSFYVHKTARAAADAAALAAVNQELANVGRAGPYPATYGPGLVDCSSDGTNLGLGCDYAKKNGFWPGGNDGRQSLKIEDGTGPSVPTAPGVVAMYWVHVVATETIPQLFSAIYGNTQGVVSADATAALVSEIVPAGLVLLNVSCDPPIPPQNGPKNDAGVDLDVQGQLTVPGGIAIASEGKPAGVTHGNGSVDTSYTVIAGSGTAPGFPNVSNVSASSSMFDDPYAGEGQPPLCPPGGTCSGDWSKYYAVPGGNLAQLCTDCPPGVYYSTGNNNKLTGAPIIINGVTFSGGPFGNYMFVGGTNISGDATLGPGRYVIVGGMQAGGSVVGGTSPTSDAGRVLILTNDNYQAYAGDANMRTILGPLRSQGLPAINFAASELKAGNASSALYGLNPNSSAVPSELLNFMGAVGSQHPLGNGIVIWQDQQNSSILYTNFVPTSDCPPTLNPNQHDPGLTLWGGSNTVSLSGVVYQPRGAHLYLHSHTSFLGQVQVITGGLDMQSNVTLSLNNPPFPATRMVAALVH